LPDQKKHQKSMIQWLNFFRLKKFRLRLIKKTHPALQKNGSRGSRVSVFVPALWHPDGRQQTGCQLRYFQVRCVETPPPARRTGHQPAHAEERLRSHCAPSLRMHKTLPLGLEGRQPACRTVRLLVEKLFEGAKINFFSLVNLQNRRQLLVIVQQVQRLSLIHISEPTRQP
jgi:hypothetical protein